MHILVVSQYFWPENFRINELVRSLTERGYHVTVLTGMPNYPEGRIYDGYGLRRNMRQSYFGAEVVRVPLVPRGKGSSVLLFLNYVSFAFFASVLSPVVIRKKFDFIFVCQLSPVTVGLPAILLKKVLKIPIVYWVLDLWPESLAAIGVVKSKIILNYVDQLVRFIYRNCDKIIVSSQGFIQSIESKGISSKRLDYFPNWYEMDYSVKQKSGLKNQFDIQKLPKGFKVMFAGNIGVAQDFETILSAAELTKKYSDIHWIILGDGRMSDWVKKEISSRGLSDSFHMLGRFSSEAMPYFFAEADAMLVTLKNDPIFSLTAPGKIQSYMACAKPIIAAVDGEGNRLITDSGSGLASPSGDPEALAESVIAIYHMTEEQKIKIGEAGRRYCEKYFNRECLMDKLDGWIKEMLPE